MEVIGSIYTGVTADFQRGVYPIARCVKAEQHDLGVVMADVNVLGSLEAKFESTNRIYDVGGCSPTEQRLEINMQGTSNCLTSVQKDNMVLIKQATKSGSIECEVGGCFDASYPESQTRRGCVQDNGNTCPTLTAQNQEIVRIEKVGQISNDGSQCGTVISDNGISSNLVAGTHGYANSHIATKYRIRKLTPRECGRLMGVSDEDISKMAAVNSNTQLYKQFGNSIVVDVMCAMFRNLNIEQEAK